ncbi:LPPG:FO 2-phospho-L-lactate transferase CofD/UPF0052 [Lasallia pustulata]|uniref:LPPG:FO 2-phospho-L-lactate transferase CofD/UPF0052 n=1 Tax=Lasallia pustulata TaxID=136370 RepID=A0A1W5D6P9_9LECA|nr:LPPG:FO 2-phospho-L-lactate transferase CofD/UPF0052 [Lasallia pustulata]
MSATPQGGIVVFSGGSAANSLVDVFNEVAEKRACPLSYVIPVSDNGGSSSEISRIIGGPGIGDVRSRLVRLIPPSHTSIRTLFNHRLPPNPSAAHSEWLSVIDGTSALWPSIPPPQRQLIRSILNHLHLELLKRARPPHSTFNFQSASIGNMFLTGARLFSGSFESAIYLLGVIGGVPESTAVIPAINTNFSHHISAGLADGTIITGQNAISHPSAPTALPDQPQQAELLDGAQFGDDGLDVDPGVEDASLPGSLPTLCQPNIAFSKSDEEPLPARIERIWYINPYGQEIRPAVNPKAVETLRAAEAVVYSIGSLYTSIVPSLILRGTGDALAKTRGIKYKILILNGSLDRETGASAAGDKPMGAVEFVEAIARAGEASRGNGDWKGCPAGRYVTHVVYLEGEGTPEVQKGRLAGMGIECVRLYGRKGENGMMRYDGKALGQALEAVLGNRGVRSDLSRRNTLEH